MRQRDIEGLQRHPCPATAILIQRRPSLSSDGHPRIDIRVDLRLSAEPGLDPASGRLRDGVPSTAGGDGRLSTVTDVRGFDRRYGDAAGRLVRITDALHRQTAISYGSDARVRRIDRRAVKAAANPP